MKVFEKIKELVRKIRNKRIEAPKEVQDGFIAPKGIREDDNIESYASSLHLSKEDLAKVPVTFGTIEKEELDKLAQEIGKMGGKLGWTHNFGPTLSGKLNGKSFASIKRINVGEQQVGQTICTENGYYDIRTSKSNPKQGDYDEHLTLEDGTNTRLFTSLGNNKGSVYSVMSKNGISLKETANWGGKMEAYEFRNFAQPSDELLEEYSKTTGLPIIMDYDKIYEDAGLKESTTGIDIKGLSEAMGEQYSSDISPYIVSIEASKQMDGEQPKKKAIKYAYTSPEAYKNGEKPYMIYMDGIDGRTGYSGMFRLKGDSYIDNSTFRRENGEYTFDTISYEEIMKLAGKMPTKLSNRANSAAIGEFTMPSEIQEIYRKATSIEMQKENPNKGQEITN